jgi:Arc/MetJ family transcription regulator
VTKRLVEIDDDVLTKAQAELGTATIKDTVNEALRLASAARIDATKDALEAIASIDFIDRDRLWR